jgi:CRP-like cAMP-binding protein
VTNVDELAAIPLFVERDVGAGVRLIGEGATGASLYVLVAGHVSITIGGDEIRTLGPGEVFGELALLAEGRRTATVTTTEPSRVLVLFGNDVERLRTDYPEVAAEIEASMRSRLG